MSYFSPFFQDYGSVCKRSFLLCPHDRIFVTNKNWILEIGSCEWALRDESTLYESQIHMNSTLQFGFVGYKEVRLTICLSVNVGSHGAICSIRFFDTEFKETIHALVNLRGAVSADRIV